MTATRKLELQHETLEDGTIIEVFAFVPLSAEEIAEEEARNLRIQTALHNVFANHPAVARPQEQPYTNVISDQDSVLSESSSDSSDFEASENEAQPTQEHPITEEQVESNALLNHFDSETIAPTGNLEQEETNPLSDNTSTFYQSRKRNNSEASLSEDNHEDEDENLRHSPKRRNI